MRRMGQIPSSCHRAQNNRTELIKGRKLNIYICIYMFICLYVYAFMYLYLYIFIFLHFYVFISLYLCKHNFFHNKGWEAKEITWEGCTMLFLNREALQNKLEKTSLDTTHHYTPWTNLLELAIFRNSSSFYLRFRKENNWIFGVYQHSMFHCKRLLRLRLLLLISSDILT